MPSLSRPSDNPHQVTWHVYSGEIRVGLIGEPAGVFSIAHDLFCLAWVMESADSHASRRKKN
jgi:hypothetical protein